MCYIVFQFKEEAVFLKFTNAVITKSILRGDAIQSVTRPVLISPLTDQVNELVALIPYSDQRLQPQRT